MGHFEAPTKDPTTWPSPASVASGSSRGST
jgi:hypothetical protein